jgi:hypothetical protein
LNYEIALAVWDSKLLWVHGPTRPGLVNDLGVFRGDGLEKSLRTKMDKEGLNIGRSFRGIADEGYGGEPQYLSTQNQFDSKEIAWFKSRAKARHESFNSKLKILTFWVGHSVTLTISIRLFLKLCVQSQCIKWSRELAFSTLILRNKVNQPNQIK